jgi:hypothetical protein
VKPREQHRPRRSKHRWPVRARRPRRSRLAVALGQRDAQQVGNFFLDFDNGFGAGQAQREAGIVRSRARQFVTGASVAPMRRGGDRSNLRAIRRARVERWIMPALMPCIRTGTKQMHIAGSS